MQFGATRPIWLQLVEDFSRRIAVEEWGAKRASTLATAFDSADVALTMGRPASVYLVDEPISGVDPVSRDAILGGILRDLREDSLVAVYISVVLMAMMSGNSLAKAWMSQWTMVRSFSSVTPVSMLLVALLIGIMFIFSYVVNAYFAVLLWRTHRSWSSRIDLR